MDYRTSWNDFTAFLEAAQEKLIEIDETIPELPTKDIVRESDNCSVIYIDYCHADISNIQGHSVQFRPYTVQGEYTSRPASVQ